VLQYLSYLRIYRQVLLQVVVVSIYTGHGRHEKSPFSPHLPFPDTRIAFGFLHLSHSAHTDGNDVFNDVFKH
jgi:hypothetical protein